MIPIPLSEGIDSLESYDPIEILEKYWADDSESKYIIHISIKHDINNKSSSIPEETKWYMIIKSNYPSGNIKIYPSENGGIKKTFAHQIQNKRGSPSNPWRTGNICVDRYDSRVGRSADREPHDAKERLLWFVKRSVEWVKSAAKGELREPGEPYEVPDFNPSTDDLTLAFNETHGSFDVWNSIESNWGTVKLSSLNSPADTFFVNEFLDENEETLYQPRWGDYPHENTEDEFSSAWLYLEEPPFQEPWAVPETWEELDGFLSGIPDGIYGLLAEFVQKSSVKENLYLLVGFPIPDKIGEEACIAHWKAIQLPPIYSPIFDGHRDTQTTRRREIESVLREKRVHWLNSENWADEQLSRRGRLSETLTDSKILVIGVGALGSLIAENLVRSGVRNVAIIDGEKFEIGNIARHTLTLDNIGESKVSAVAERLRSLSPHVEVEKISSSFPPSGEYRNRICDIDLVIDCTGEDSVLEQLRTYPWYDTVRFCSVSMGRRGNRLFVFRAHNNRFPYERFTECINRWLIKEDLEKNDDDIVAERVGCWHPASVIPMDRVAAWAGVVPSLIEELMDFRQGDFELTALERDQNTISKIERPFPNSIKWASTVSSRTVELLKSCDEKMMQLCVEAREKEQETGGILVGKYTDEGKNALVAIADEPAPDSIQTATTLHRGTEGVNEWLAEQRKLKDVRYLGEWHYHPNGRPKPSKTDEDTLKGITENDDYSCSRPIMVIVGHDSESEFTKRVYTHHESEGIEKLEKSD